MRFGLGLRASNKVFARKGKRATIDERAAGVWRLAGQRQPRRLHVWRRNLVGPEFRGKVAEPLPSVAEIEAAIRKAAPSGEIVGHGLEPTRPAI